MKNVLLLVSVVAMMLSCSDSDSNDATLAVYKSTFYTVTPSTSIVTEERWSPFSIEQMKGIFNPTITNEETTLILTTEGEEIKEDITFTLRETSAVLDIKADVTDKTHIYDVTNEVLTFSAGEYTYQGMKFVVTADGIIYKSMAVGGEITERNIFELSNYRYVTEISRKEKSVEPVTNKKNFHSEVSYNQPLVALRFIDGVQVYKCSIEDQDRVKLERIEPEYKDYGFLEKVK